MQGEIPRVLEKAREKILGDGYGKFDLVEKLFDCEELLKERPRTIKDKICERLHLAVGEFPYRSFISWLRRYRKSNAAVEREGKEKAPGEGEAARPNKDFLHYQPAEIKPAQAASPLFKKPG